MSSPIQYSALLGGKAASAPALPAAESSSLASDFSKWLDKHAGAATQSSPMSQPGSSATAPSPAPQTGVNTSAALEARNVAARAQANALAARRQALAPKGAQTPQAPQMPRSEAQPAPPKPAQAKAADQPAKPPAGRAGKTQGHDGQDGQDDKTTAKAADESQAAPAQATSDDKTAATVDATSAQSASLLPSATESAPSSSMLAWLAGLNQGAAQTDPQLATQHTGADAAQPGDLLAGDATDARKGSMTLTDLAQQAVAQQAVAQKAAVNDEALAAGEPAQGAAETEFAGTLSAELMRGAGLSAHTSHVQSPAAQTSEALPTPVNSPEFPQALAERVGMWVKSTGEGGTLTAELHLNPAEMGPISVKIALDGQSARVDFAAATLETRRAIENSLPLLSAALDDVGLKLGGSGVSDQPAQQQFGQSRGDAPGTPSWGAAGHGLNAASGTAGPDEAGATNRATRAALKGGLDLYA